MRKQLSKYKFKKLAIESLKNGLRLHFDSVTLYRNKAYPTALQISIIAIEEIAKAKMIEHYYYSSMVNNGFPDEDFEQKWLKLLYNHNAKQYAFIAREIFDYSPQFIEFIKKGDLDKLKQRATYVGLDKIKNKIDVNSRISVPNRIGGREAKRTISLVNNILIEMCEIRQQYDVYWDIDGMNEIIDNELLEILKQIWGNKTRFKSIRKI